MRIRIIVTGVTAAAALGVGAPAAHAAATWKSCGEVSFSGGAVADSHYGATNIRALRTGCAIAKSVARGVQNARDHRYTSHGFVCSGHVTGGGYSAYSCVKTQTDSDGLHDKVRFTAVGVG